MKAFCILFIGILLNTSVLNSQNTVGTINITEDVSDGYTLFSPNFSFNTYLIDNCGRVVNEWNANYRPGLSVYLLEDGTLMRTGRGVNSDFSAGGVGGVMEHYDWNNNLLWSWQYSSSDYVQHHDIEVLPSGNLLIISFDERSTLEAIDQGRNPSLLADNELWPEKILEIRPIGVDSAEIVWEWYMWDHLIQDYDSTKVNYGVVADHPELFNLNYVPNNHADWCHVNSIDYNSDRDEIVLSSRSFNEIWIIDHSTTTQEAASHSGGNSGKGGDLLYRWGNNAAFNRPVSNADLDGQHDAEWIPQGFNRAGQIMIFDNGNIRGYSSIKIINPTFDGQGNYVLESDTTYGPNEADWLYENNPDFYSGTLSGANPLLNGNIMACEGTSGHFTEIDSLGNIVWEYVNPVTNQGITTQGDPVLGVNTVFRSIKYDATYAGLIGKDLTPGQPLEINPDLSDCISTGVNEVFSETLNVYPNPVKDLLYVDAKFNGVQMTLMNVVGEVVLSNEINGPINLAHLEKGVYWIKIHDSVEKFIKL